MSDDISKLKDVLDKRYGYDCALQAKMIAETSMQAQRIDEIYKQLPFIYATIIFNTIAITGIIWRLA